MLKASGSRLAWPGGGGGEETVEWVNADRESGLPYDIVIHLRHDQPGDSGAARSGASGAAAEGDSGCGESEVAGLGDEQVFIEVKSTRDCLDMGAGQQPFPLSVNELLFALRYGPRLQACCPTRP